MEKCIWELNTGDAGWVTIHPNNLDEDGNLKGVALDFKNSMETPEGNFYFRQTSESKIGTGDSTGLVKILLEV